MRRVVLHIDELQIQGREALDPAAFQHALQQALSDHIAEYGIPEGWHGNRDIPQVTARYNGEQASTELLGQQAAQLIYGKDL